MKILITGGAGFIGSNLSAALVQAGHQVTILDNLSTGHQKNIAHLDLEFVKGDISNTEILDRLIKGKDAVFHLAASVGNIRSIENPAEDNRNNYLGTLQVLEAIRKHRVPKLIYSSTAAGYGEPNYLPVDENHPINPDSPYGITKIAAEKLALCYAKLYGFQVVALRYFNAYGLNQRFDAYGNVIPIFVSRIIENRALTVFGDGEQTRDFVNVKDLVNANLLGLKAAQSGYYNIATGQQTTINTLIENLRKICGKKLEVEYLPARKGEVIHSVAGIEKARRELNYTSQVDFYSGLEEYFKWMQQEG